LARGPSIDKSLAQGHAALPLRGFFKVLKSICVARAPTIGITHERPQWTPKAAYCDSATFGQSFD